MTNHTAERADVEAIVARVRKLLALAGNNPNEAEAASATAMAAKILAQHNLEMSTVVAAGGADTGQRGEDKIVGGFHEWERQLWRVVAELNLCVYFSEKTSVPREKRDARSAGRADQDFVKRRVHRLVGRRVNVVSTQVMAEYLLQASGRLADEYVGDPRLRRSQAALSFREGAAERLTERVRRLSIDREQAARAEQQQRNQARAAAGGTPGTALVLGDVMQAERDANTDFIYGEGTSARRRAQTVQLEARWAAEARERAVQAREEQRLHDAWAAANPAAAAKEQARQERETEKKRKQDQRFWERQSARQEKPRDHRAYEAGSRAGDGLSLDRQVDRAAPAPALPGRRD